MSVVIVGGHDRMCREYVNVCKKYNCKAKVFTQMTTDFKNKIGNPDALILLTNTVSHKMVNAAKKEADKKNICIIRNHNSSIHSLESTIQEILTGR